jgi:hypothetical protein
MFAEGTRTGKQLATALDRHLCFSYSSFAFLRRHGFQFQEAFENGVPYLSRQEAEELDGGFLRLNGRQIAGFDLAQHEEVVQDFYNGAQRAIHFWLIGAKDEDAMAYLNISNPYGGRLTGFQIQLIHHLIEVQFPRCNAQPKHDDMFMQITLADVKEKEKIMHRQFQERKEAVIRQTGFRYLIDAMTGNFFTEDLRTEWMVDDDCEDIGRRASELQAELEKYEAKLTAKPPITVGHNQFYDLCFIHQTFIGDLPPNLEDFRAKIHTLFPRMVDTKFLATPPKHHIMMADDNLSMLYDIAKDQEIPIIVQDARLGGHMKHQAGYDSWMTAVVFARKAWNLNEEFCMNLESGVQRDWVGKIVKRDGDSQIGKPPVLSSSTVRKEVKQTREAIGTSIDLSFDPRKEFFPSPSRPTPTATEIKEEKQKPAAESRSRDFEVLRQFFPKSSRLGTRSTPGPKIEDDSFAPKASGRWLGTSPTSAQAPPSASATTSIPNSHERIHTEPQQEPSTERRLSVKSHSWGRAAGDAFQSIETARARRTLPSIVRRNVPKPLRDQSQAKSKQSRDPGSEDEPGQKWPKNPETAFTSTSVPPSSQTRIYRPRGQALTGLHVMRAVAPSFSHPPFFAPTTNPVFPVGPVLTPLRVQQQETMGSFGAADSSGATTSSAHQQRIHSQGHTTVPAVTTRDEDDHNAGYGTESGNDSNTVVDDLETQHRIPDWEMAFWRKYGNRIRVGTSGSLDLESEWVVQK